MTQTVNVIPVELTELRSASTANGGTALTTTLGLISIPLGADYISITPRNFSADCKAAGVLLNPYLSIFHTQNAGQDTTDLSDEMQDGDATSVEFVTFAITGTGYMYVGARVPFLGVQVGLGTNKNATASVLTVNYWKPGGWTDISDNDGTITGTESMSQSGDVVWTIPTTWQKTSLSAIGDTLPASCNKYEERYWTRWEWSAALDTVAVNTMRTINRSTTYAEYIEGQAVELKLSDREISCVQAITGAGTANLIVNVGSLIGSEFE